MNTEGRVTTIGKYLHSLSLPLTLSSFECKCFLLSVLILWPMKHAEHAFLWWRMLVKEFWFEHKSALLKAEWCWCEWPTVRRGRKKNIFLPLPFPNYKCKIIVLSPRIFFLTLLSPLPLSTSKMAAWPLGIPTWCPPKYAYSAGYG